MPKRKRFIKYGGVEFEQVADSEAIAIYVSKLPEDRRTSLYAVVKALSDAQMIVIPPDPDFTTYDSDFLTWSSDEDAAHAPFLADLCPACRAPLRFTEGISDGTFIECAHCGADLVVMIADGVIDLRLESEIFG